MHNVRVHAPLSLNPSVSESTKVFAAVVTLTRGPCNVWIQGILITSNCCLFKQRSQDNKQRIKLCLLSWLLWISDSLMERSMWATTGNLDYNSHTAWLAWSNDQGSWQLHFKRRWTAPGCPALNLTRITQFGTSQEASLIPTLLLRLRHIQDTILGLLS